MPDFLTFQGRDRATTKRKALAWWVENRSRLGIDMTGFLTRCTITPDGTIITFRAVPARVSVPARPRV